MILVVVVVIVVDDDFVAFIVDELCGVHLHLKHIKLGLLTMSCMRPFSSAKDHQDQ